MQLAGHHLTSVVGRHKHVAESGKHHAAHFLLLDVAEDRGEGGDQRGGRRLGGGLFVVEGEPGGAAHLVEKLELGRLDVGADDALETLETVVGCGAEKSAVVGNEKKLVKCLAGGADVENGAAVELPGNPLDKLCLLIFLDVTLLAAINNNK